MNINYQSLPAHMQDAARLYVERGISGGRFFNAVVSNDLMTAFATADDINRFAMWDWCNFLYNEVPSTAHGSPEIVAAWIERGGTNGREKAA